MTGGCRRVASALIVILAALMAPGIVSAQEAFFAEGNQRYQAADYEGAVEQYDRVLTAGFESGALYYNLGNAHFKLGHLGQAVLAYERARRITPGDRDLLANLELARSLTEDDITPLPAFWPIAVVRWWTGLLSRTALVMVVATAYLLAIGSFVVLIVRRETRRHIWIRSVAVTAAIVTVVFGINLTVRELRLGAPDEGVIVVAAVEVQSAPADDSQPGLFTIHEGTTVRIDRASDEWLEIVLADGSVGWVKGDVLERI